jgi:phage tail sheath gpL-like
MKTRLLLLGIVIAAIALVQPLGAASATSSVTVSATVAATAKLSLSAATVSFANADPDTTPSIAASEGAITVTAKGKTAAGSNITLTLQAADDLKSGTDVILASAVTWTATGTGFVAGTMSKAAAVSVGSWTGSGNRAGSLSFALVNSWSYPTGSYSAAATYTLTAP